MNILDFIAPNRVRFGVQKPGRTYARDLQIRLGGDESGRMIPFDVERQHFFFNGASGSGKTLGVRQAVSFICRRPKDRMVIIDPEGSLYATIGRPQDTVANPFDARCPAVSLSGEIEKEGDSEHITMAAIPKSEGAVEEWNGYTRHLVEAVFSRSPNASPATLYDLLFKADRDELAELVDDTPARRIFEPGADRMLASVLAVMSARLSWLRYLRDPSTGQKVFTFTRWAREAPPGSRLFLTYTVKQRAALMPFYSTGLGLLSAELLSQPPVPQPSTAQNYRRTWIIADEWGLLGRTSGMEEVLTNGRRFGVAGIFGSQDIQRLQISYGEKATTSMLNSIGTWLILAQNDGTAAEYLSRALGDHQVKRTLAGSNWSGSARRDTQNNSTSEQVSTERLVLTGELLHLQNRIGFLRVRGDPDLHQIFLPVTEFPPGGQPAFIARPDALLPQPFAGGKPEGDDGSAGPGTPPISL